jgi:hypothetical protein
MKNLVKSLLCVSSVVLIGVAIAGPEAGHPNIQAANKDVNMALEKMHAAQVANEYDLGGHAANAEKLLREAQAEMKQAAETANKKGK